MKVFPSKDSREEQGGGGSEESAPVLSPAALAMTLFLSQLRAQVIVGVQLASKFPREEDWWALLKNEDYVGSLNSLAEIMNDVVVDSEELTPQVVAAAASNHYNRATEAIEPVADMLEVGLEDLLAVLSNAG